MADCHHVGTRLEDRGVDGDFAVEPVGRRHHRLAVEIEHENVCGLHQLGRAMARDQEVLGILGMAQAHMTESVEHAFIGEDAIGEGYLLTRLGEAVGHSWLSVDGDLLGGAGNVHYFAPRR
jgi:hypothetical protein